jgi:hypothetical protein
MKRYLSIFSVLMMLLGTVACQPPFPETTSVQTVVVPATAVLAVTTLTPMQRISPTALPPAPPTPATGPQCTVLKNVNFRKGPGTAFQPPLRELKAGAQVIPQGFNSQGFPAGSWVLVLEPVENQPGWVNMDPQFISCNVNLTALPQVAVEPPPPPPAPVVSNSQVDGEPNGLEGRVEFSPHFLMRMNVHGPDGSNDGDGIKRVTFTISDGNGIVYQRTENNAGYCIFGGGEPDCNPWTQVNGQNQWGEGGQPVKAGTYNVLIEAEPHSANGDESQFGRWFFSITVQLY